jgi:primosomal protein DnaI
MISSLWEVIFMKKLNEVTIPVSKKVRPINKDAQLKILCTFPLIQSFMNEHPELDQNVYRRSFSLLQQFVVERSHCDACPGLDKCPNMMKGHYPVLHEYGGYIDLSLKECSKFLQAKEEKWKKSLIKSHHIPREIQNASFETIDYNPGRDEAINAAIDFCMGFAEKNPYRGLYLYGPFGVGKSYIAGAITNELAGRGIRSIMVHFPSLVEELKSSLGDETNQLSEKLEALKQTQVLIFDDIGAESLTPWIRDDILATVLQYRMTEQLPTIYTSNMTLDELEEHFSHTAKGGYDILKGRRLMERIRPFVKAILVNGRNRRYGTSGPDQ